MRHTVGKYTVEIERIFAWYDFWVGLYWDRDKKWLYFFPIPMFGFIFKFERISDEQG